MGEEEEEEERERKEERKAGKPAGYRKITIFHTPQLKLLQARVIVDIKIRRQKYDETQDIYIVSRYPSTKCLLISKRKIVT